jgi:condensin complex subunit 2
VYDNDAGDVITALVEPGEQDLLASAQQRRRVRPETVNYARRAKRVDVRKLKENIWKNLDIVVPEKLDEQDEDAMVRLLFVSSL